MKGMNFMTDEIFYLESCLAIEKSMEAVRESVRCEYNDFMFESPKDVFETIKRKILELIQKVKSIFTGAAMKKKDAEAIKKAKSAKGGTMKVRDSKKLSKLYSSCRKDIKSGKDPEKVKARWKKGLVVLGFVAAAAGTGAAIKYRKAKDVKSSEVSSTLRECNTTILTASKDLEKDAMEYGKPIKLEDIKLTPEEQKNVNSVIIQSMKPYVQYRRIESADLVMQAEKNKRREAQALSELYSDLMKATNATKQDVYAGVNNLLPGPNTDDEEKAYNEKRRKNRIDGVAQHLEKIQHEIKKLSKYSKLSHAQKNKLYSLKEQEKTVIEELKELRDNEKTKIYFPVN